jgi:hypothetical protein
LVRSYIQLLENGADFAPAVAVVPDSNTFCFYIPFDSIKQFIADWFRIAANYRAD